ncbi:MAG TPA: 4Fe-4S dicluster domain-containing protein [Longilinea sp.]|nr:4Fe-4S dicluster domain-containing protein [Longilinea sp.]
MAEQPTKKWGLVIDLDRCSGCQACVTACSMENNIPFTGEDEVAYGRGMHWIRVQRYWKGEYPEVKPDHNPVMCQQCGNAPCEPVCPVFASVHSEEEQINVQVYNRCIGTRYCANNCPYVARTFNWFDYEIPAPMNYYLNPDVTVRRRGVMEKCTFCVQRIKHGEDVASAEGRALEDGEVMTACQQACPTDAIVFGDLSSPESRVSKLARSERGYHIFEELGTLPSVTYLKGGGYYGG